MMNRLEAFFLMASTLVLVALSLPFLTRDLWWDECISLAGFALQDLVTTLTSYPEPNNHILYNLSNNLVTRLIGVRDIAAWLDRVWLLRSLHLLLALGTVGMTFAFARRFLGSLAASIAAILLVTSLPFLNFALQLRGYAPSMFLLVTVLFLLWECAAKGGAGRATLLAGSVFALLYTIPSNAYFVIALGLLPVTGWIAGRLGRPDLAPIPSSGASPAPWLLMITAMGVGCALAALAYLPVMEQVRHNVFMDRVPPGRGYVLGTTLPHVFLAFLSARFLLLPVLLGGLLRLQNRWGRSDAEPGRSHVPALLILLLIPFGIAFLRNDLPFPRTFVPLAPVAALLLAGPLAAVLRTLVAGPTRRGIALGVLLLYCTATAVWQLEVVQQDLARDLTHGTRSQNLLRNYYQAKHYTPGRSTTLLAQAVASQPGPIILVDPFDRISVPYYLARHGLRSYLVRTVEALDAPADGKTHACTFQLTHATPEGDLFSSATIEMNLAGAPGRVHFLQPALQLVTRNDPSDHIYVVTAFAEAFRELYEAFYTDAFRLERLDDERSSSTLFRLTRIRG